MHASDEAHGGDPAGRAVSLVDRILDGFARACMLVAGVLMVILIVIFGWLVFGRYVLNNTPTWVEQASLLLVAYITFLGAAIGIRRNSHLSIDFVREALPRGPRLVLRYVADLMIFVFGGFMAWQGWGLVETNLDRAIPMIDLPEAWRAAPLVICGLLIMVFSTADLIERIRDPLRGD